MLLHEYAGPDDVRFSHREELRVKEQKGIKVTVTVTGRVTLILK